MSYVFQTELPRELREHQQSIAKHAEASAVTVLLRFTPGTVSLLVEDDGRGFDANTRGLGGWGLLGMQERASLLGGQCRVDSTAGEGTRVWTTVPLPAELLEMNYDTSKPVVG